MVCTSSAYVLRSNVPYSRAAARALRVAAAAAGHGERPGEAFVHAGAVRHGGAVTRDRSGGGADREAAAEGRADVEVDAHAAREGSRGPAFLQQQRAGGRHVTQIGRVGRLHRACRGCARARRRARCSRPVRRPRRHGGRARARSRRALRPSPCRATPYPSRPRFRTVSAWRSCCLPFPPSPWNSCNTVGSVVVRYAPAEAPLALVELP